MRVTLKACHLRSLALAAALSLPALSGAQAQSDSAYINQVPAGARVLTPALTVGQAAIQPGLYSSPRSQPVVPTPQNTLGSGGNVAQTLQVGAYNRVAQIQAGANNTSAVGVIGVNNNVGVLQAGNNLRSNLVLLGTQGLNVGVIQPNGSIPVNMLIARLPNGGLLIKR
jgi:hypothetical protein